MNEETPAAAAAAGVDLMSDTGASGNSIYCRNGDNRRLRFPPPLVFNYDYDFDQQ